MLDRIAIKIKDHPVFVILGFVGAVVLPICALLTNWLSPLWATLAIVTLVGAIAIVRVKPWSSESEPSRIAEAEAGDRRASSQGNLSGDEYREYMRRHLLGQYGDKARIEYFHSRAEREDASDSLYREVIEAMQNDAKWGPIASGVDEWVTIGFETLVSWRGAFRNAGTLRRLYKAAHNALLNESLLGQPGLRFAEHVSAEVATRRRYGL